MTTLAHDYGLLLLGLLIGISIAVYSPNFLRWWEGTGEDVPVSPRADFVPYTRRVADRLRAFVADRDS